jgi:hypothetical protein
MDENEVIPFGSERSRELLRMRQQGGLMPPEQPMDAPASSQDLIKFGTPQSRQMLEGRADPLREYTWGEIPLASVKNLPRSAADFYGGLVEAITSPVETATAMLDVGAGALRSATPKPVRDFIDRLDRDPAAAERATEVAKAAGQFYADSYGSVSKIKRKLAEDPVGVLADFSTIMSGGAMAAGRSPQLAAGLQRAADLTNPVMPLVQAVQGRVPGTQSTVPELIGKGVGAGMDLASGDLGVTMAQRTLRQALGPDNVLRAQQMNTPQFDRLTAGEAAIGAGIFSPEIQALQTIAAERNPQVYGQLRRQGEAERKGLIAAVTPDETAARTFRQEASDPYFQSAQQQAINVTPELRSTLKALPDNILNEARKLAKLDPEGAGQLNLAVDTIDGRTLSYISSAIRDELAKPQATTKTGRTQRKMLGDRLDVLTREMESQIPAFREGRQVFAELSPPVDQARVLNEMQRRLTGPMDQERAGQFMRVLGEGEQAMLRRSTGYPRYQEGDLMRLLSEEQGQAVTRVSDQLTRQAEMRVQASEGMEAMRRIIKENENVLPRAPHMLNRAVMIFNRAMRTIGGSVTKDTQALLDQAMRSGQDFNALLNSIPASQRSAVVQALSKVGSELSPDKLRNIGLMGTLAEETEEPFRAELRGMAQ